MTVGNERLNYADKMRMSSVVHKGGKKRFNLMSGQLPESQSMYKPYVAVHPDSVHALRRVSVGLK